MQTALCAGLIHSPDPIFTFARLTKLSLFVNRLYHCLVILLWVWQLFPSKRLTLFTQVVNFRQISTFVLHFPDGTEPAMMRFPLWAEAPKVPQPLPQLLFGDPDVEQKDPHPTTFCFPRRMSWQDNSLRFLLFLPSISYMETMNIFIIPPPSSP